MTTTYTCSWCHALATVRPGYTTYCPLCGHRADLSRMDCDCTSCRPRFGAAAASATVSASAETPARRQADR